MTIQCSEVKVSDLGGVALSYAFAKAELEGELNQYGKPKVVTIRMLGVFVDAFLFNCAFNVDVGRMITKYRMSVCPTTFYRGGKLIMGFHAHLNNSDQNGYVLSVEADTINDAVCRLVVLHKLGAVVKIPINIDLNDAESPHYTFNEGFAGLSIYYVPSDGYFCAKSHQELDEWFVSELGRSPVDCALLPQSEAKEIVINIETPTGHAGLNLVDLARKTLLESGGYKAHFQV